jgi:hypothetical protein
MHESDVVDIVQYDKQWQIALLVHNSGSGLPSLDVYVYGCDETSCA